MKPSDLFDILEEWYKERKRHSDKSFKQWLKHVGGLWTSKEEWAKLGKWETWKPVPKEVGKQTGKALLTKILVVAVLLLLTTLGFD
jgi:hypothetical protein